jgi:glutathione S-transferase
MAGGFILHGSPHSLPTYKVALMLRLCGVGFSFRYVSFQRGMHQTPEFRALSRWGQVPVLEHDGRVLLQSAAILDYLSETLGRFAAADREARQQVREWLFWDADRLMPPLYGWYGVELGRRKLLPLSFEPAVVSRWQRLGEAALGVLDGHLGGMRMSSAARRRSPISAATATSPSPS